MPMPWLVSILPTALVMISSSFLFVLPFNSFIQSVDIEVYSDETKTNVVTIVHGLRQQAVRVCNKFLYSNAINLLIIIEIKGG